MHQTISTQFVYFLRRSLKYWLYLGVLKNVLIFIVAIHFLSCSEKKQAVDLILHHATIYTVDSSFKVTEAMAIKDGKIIAVNSTKEILEHFDAPVIQDVNGKT